MLEELRRRRPLPGDDIGVIVGRNDGGAALPGQPTRNVLTVLAVAIVSHHLAAVAEGRLHFRRRRIFGHDDGRLNAEHPGGQRHRLGMVAG